MSDPNLRHLDYRDDIQGLRGIAVLLVLLNHLKFPGFEYGYLGVDIFFVISGYVITGLICQKVCEGKWSLKDFYVRRVWRLLPALYVVLLLSLLAALFSPDSLKAQLVEAIPYAASGVSNIFFYFNTGYFDNESIFIPVLHTWSLSVEEQFYLLFAPMFAFALSRNLHVWAVLLTFVIMSAIAVFWLNDDNAIFYLLPSRAAELLAGVVCYLLVRRFSFEKLNSFLPNIIVLVLTLCLVPIFSLVDMEPFVAAVLVSAATMMFLLGGGAIQDKVFGQNAALLWLGAVSYSLYLAHWPIISFAHVNGIYIDDFLMKVAFFVASLVAGQLIYAQVERRFYFDRRGKGFYSIYSILIIYLFIVVSAIALPKLQKDVSINDVDYSVYFKENYTQRFEYGQYGTCFMHEVKKHVFDDDCMALSSSRPNLMLIGDSHAAYLSAGVREHYPEYNVMQSTAVACPPILGAGKGHTCKERNKEHFDFLSNNDVEIVMVFANWIKYDLSNLVPTLNALKKDGRKVILIAGSPKYKKHLARILFDSKDLKEAEAYADSINPYGIYGNSLHHLASLADKLGITFYSIPELLCSKEGNCDIVDEQMNPIFYDYGHVTEEGAKYIIERLRQDDR